MNSKTSHTSKVENENVCKNSSTSDTNSVNLLSVQEEDDCATKISKIKSRSHENLAKAVTPVKENGLAGKADSKKETKKLVLPHSPTSSKFKEKHIPKDVAEISIKVATDPFDLEQKGWTRFLGIFLALMAGLQFSISALIIKLLEYHPLNLGVWRFGAMSLIPIPILAHSAFCGKQAILGNCWPLSFKTSFLVMLQAILGANSVIFFFFGLKFLDIGDCIVIGTSAPVFVTFFAFLFLGERCGLFPVITALLTLFGVGIISKPPIITGAEHLNEETMIGVSASISCMILLTIFYIVLRYLRNVHHVLLNLCYSLWGFLQSLLMAYLMDVLETPDSYREICLIIISALLAFSAQTCINLALRYEEAGPVSLVRTSEVVFAFWWQALFLGVIPDVFSVVGAVITLSGVVLTALRKMIMSLPDDHKYKQWFCFFLL